MARGIAGVQLPEADRARHPQSHCCGAFPARARRFRQQMCSASIDDIVALLQWGAEGPRATSKIDTAALPDFHRRVYDVARTIPAGATLSYGEDRRAAGRPVARPRGREALGQNPFPIIVPCHRVLAAGGKMGGFSARGGVRTKLRLLSIEGAEPGGPTLFGRCRLAAGRGGVDLLDGGKSGSGGNRPLSG